MAILKPVLELKGVQFKHLGGTLEEKFEFSGDPPLTDAEEKYAQAEVIEKAIDYLVGKLYDLDLGGDVVDLDNVDREVAEGQEDGEEGSVDVDG